MKWFSNQITISERQFNTVLQQFFFYSPSLCFSNPLLMEGLSHYIEFFKSSPSYICSSSNPALKYVSYQAFSLALCERQQLRPLFRGLLHINAARKVAAVHLMRWWQLFPQIFLYPYPIRTIFFFLQGFKYSFLFFYLIIGLNRCVIMVYLILELFQMIYNNTNSDMGIGGKCLGSRTSYEYNFYKFNIKLNQSIKSTSIRGCKHISVAI